MYPLICHHCLIYQEFSNLPQSILNDLRHREGSEISGSCLYVFFLHGCFSLHLQILFSIVCVCQMTINQVEESEVNFVELVHSLLEDPSERKFFFQVSKKLAPLLYLFICLSSNIKLENNEQQGVVITLKH